jgi:ketosteroid isomerase-like protein
MMPEESTTPDLEEKVRRVIEADRRDLDAGVAFFAPDAVWDTSPLGMRVFEGREAIRGMFEDWWETFEEDERELEEFRDLGNGVTFGVLFQRGRPAGSSGFVELHAAMVATWADGLIERLTAYVNVDEARVAAERLAEERG